LGLFLHRLAHSGHHVQTVAAWGLEDGDGAGGVAVQAAAHAVVFRAQFHAGHVLQQHLRPGVAPFHHDAAELLGAHQSALQLGCIRVLCAGQAGLAAELSAGHDGVVRAHRLLDVGDGDAQRVHAIGLQPHAHGVLAAAEHRHITHALDALEGIHHVDIAEVVQEGGVVGAVGAREAHQHQREHQ